VVTHRPETEGNGLYLLSGALLDDGNYSVSETGILFSESFIFEPNASNVARIVAEEEDDGAISVEVNHLTEGESYFYRAYAMSDAGFTIGAIKRFVATGGASEESAGEHEEHAHSDPWVGAEPAEGGWLNVPWFGAILPLENGWIYHVEFGWLFSVPDGSGGVWLWEQEHGWHWTNESLYPYIYRDQPKGWIYYLTTMEGRSYFYNYSTGRVE